MAVLVDEHFTREPPDVGPKAITNIDNCIASNIIPLKESEPTEKIHGTCEEESLSTTKNVSDAVPVDDVAKEWTPR